MDLVTMMLTRNGNVIRMFLTMTIITKRNECKTSMEPKSWLFYEWINSGLRCFTRRISSVNDLVVVKEMSTSHDFIIVNENTSGIERRHSTTIHKQCTENTATVASGKTFRLWSLKNDSVWCGIETYFPLVLCSKKESNYYTIRNVLDIFCVSTRMILISNVCLLLTHYS